MSSVSPSAKPYCPDCGEYPVSHKAEWFSALIDSTSTPLLAPIDLVSRKIGGISKKISLDKLALPLFRTLTFFRLGTIKSSADNHDILRTKLLWHAADERGIILYQFQAFGRANGTAIFVAYSGKNVRAFEGLPRPQRTASRSLAWMDNKATLKKKFIRAKIPMAKGRACMTYSQALKTFNEIGAPVITKPNLGSRSRHSTVHIMDATQLKKGFFLARQLSPWVIVEEELQGYVFRILLVNGKPVGILRREPAHVIGNGTDTIRTLAKKENTNPLRQGPSFHMLPMDRSATAELERQGYGWDSIPKSGTLVTLNSVASRFFGGSTTDFTDRVHPDNVKLFEYIGTVLKDSLVGVDFIIGDMERSWKEQKLCGVIECNSLPNIELHNDVLYGKSLDAAGLLFDLAFPHAERISSDNASDARLDLIKTL